MPIVLTPGSYSPWWAYPTFLSAFPLLVISCSVPCMLQRWTSQDNHSLWLESFIWRPLNTLNGIQKWVFVLCVFWGKEFTAFRAWDTAPEKAKHPASGNLLCLEAHQCFSDFRSVPNTVGPATCAGRTCLAIYIAADVCGAGMCWGWTLVMALSRALDCPFGTSVHPNVGGKTHGCGLKLTRLKSHLYHWLILPPRHPHN